jgi:hypothetical protein
VRDFSTIAAPLNDLMKKGVPFYWCVAQEHSFNALIDKLTHAPLLQLPDFGKTFELECDASGIRIVELVVCCYKKVNLLLTLVKIEWTFAELFDV